MNKKSKPILSVIIPTRNSALHLGRMLESLKLQTYTNFEIIINDSPDTSDNTPNLIERYRNQLDILYIRENDSMAQARLVGTRHTRSSIFLHLDSDMQLEHNLIEQCVDLNAKYDALVIPEQSIGNGYWGKCKVLEKQFYQGVVQMESIRCMKKNIYNKVGGHDPNLVFSEDKDLDIRIRKINSHIGYTQAKIIHNEGNPKLSDLINKKRVYSDTASKFHIKHPGHYAWQVNPINRYIIFLRNYRYLFKDPYHYLGLYILKTMEYAVSGLSFLMKR